MQVKLLSFQQCNNHLTSEDSCDECTGHGLESMWFKDKICTIQKNYTITNPFEGKVSKEQFLERPYK